jgi:L-threonylcarbamoyladenylate synthase
MPNHPLALKLIELTGQPLVAPSANLSGKPSSTEVAHVLEDFEGKIAAVVEGGASVYGIESTVIRLGAKEPLLLRLGALNQDEIERVLGNKIARGGSGQGSPGMLHRHYAPQTPIHLFSEEKALKSALKTHPLKSCLVLSTQERGCFPEGEEAPLSAQRFYKELRGADRTGKVAIFILLDAEVSQDLALMDRIHRAAQVIASYP